MRYQVPVTVTLRANSENEATERVQRLVDEAPTSYRVQTNGWRFDVTPATEVNEVRTDQTFSLTEDERQVVEDALAKYRAE